VKDIRRLRKIPCILFALGCALPSAGGAPTEYVYLPNPEGDDAAMLSGETWVGVGPDFTLRVQLIDEDERRAFIEKVAGYPTDPFASPPDRPSGYVTFVMELENQGGASLLFRAQQCWLVTSKNEHLDPISMEGLRARYGLVGGEMSSVYARSVTALLPTTQTLEAGESLAGLLVYRISKPNPRWYKLEIQITTANGDVTTITAPYRRVKQNRSESP
jgi:hypothetical protein